MRSTEETKKGTVIEAMPNTLFRVLTEDNREVISYLSGKMRMHKIRVLVGDTVEILEDPYGGKARIQKRG
jgi:translation initiation factor IF-1